MWWDTKHEGPCREKSPSYSGCSGNKSDEIRFTSIYNLYFGSNQSSVWGWGRRDTYQLFGVSQAFGK